MIVLGLESTCDETGCAVVISGKKILSNCVLSQIETHQPYKGVVPELASRKHVDAFVPLLNQALKESSLLLSDIELIAVSKGPGLIGALLVGINFAKGLSLGSKIPLIGVNHIEAHLYACMMSDSNIKFPALGLVISGGHTCLVFIEAIGKYRLIGQTVDDAIGEAFDKVAVLLDLPYPGGPAIESLARHGNGKKYSFKSGHVKNKPLDFSFSGLKTAVLYLLKGQNGLKEIDVGFQVKADVAASFQEAALIDIVQKTNLASRQYGCQTVLIGGGVSNNSRLKELFKEFCSHLSIIWPTQGLSLDNAAMIAGLGHHQFLKNGPDHPAALEAFPRIQF